MKRRSFLKSALALSSGIALPKIAFAATRHQIVIEGFKFNPATLDVKVGDIITFINKDSAPHTATADRKSWSTTTLKNGQSAELLVASGLETAYFCKFHPKMKGRLNIT
ncbi:MAG: cupredoxin domain-containing protein [Paracoccaceae bacterium]